MTLDAFPTRVILMAEYSAALPLWDRSPSPDKWFGPFPRGVLGLSDDLENRLVGWNARFELLMGQNQEWPSPAEHLGFVVDGHLLAADLQREFRSAVVVLYLDADAERSRAPRPATADAAGWQVAGADGSTFSPAATPRPSIVEQMRAMPDATFTAMTRTVDLAASVWTPGRTPTRILLEPREGGSPLLDRSPLLNLSDDTLDPAALGLSVPLVDRLAGWNERWAVLSVTEQQAGAAEEYLGYLIDGHNVAAAVQAEVGPDIQVLFPEADRVKSTPSDELRYLLRRVQALRGAD